MIFVYKDEDSVGPIMDSLMGKISIMKQQQNLFFALQVFEMPIFGVSE